MTTINTLPSLQDVTSRMDPNGRIAPIVELLQQSNPLLEDMVWKEGNLPTGHVFTSRKSLPSGTWRRFNEGVAASKSRTDQVTETCGMLDAKAQCDVDLAKLNGNEAAFRLSENKAFIMGLNNDLETAMFYSSTKTDPEKIMGLSPRLDSTSGDWGGQIIKHNASASGSDQTSIWLVGWGPDTAYGIFPKGMPGGLEMDDMGKQLVSDGTNEYRAWVTYFSWKVGLCVQDARYVVRLCNIDTTAGQIASTGMALIQDMIKMVGQIHSLKGVRPAFYCNRHVATYLHLQALDSVKNSTLSIENIAGKPVTMFMGIPVRTSDAITITEAVIS